jgi:hypothetical protein
LHRVYYRDGLTQTIWYLGMTGEISARPEHAARFRSEAKAFAAGRRSWPGTYDAATRTCMGQGGDHHTLCVEPIEG